MFSESDNRRGSVGSPLAALQSYCYNRVREAQALLNRSHGFRKHEERVGFFVAGAKARCAPPPGWEEDNLNKSLFLDTLDGSYRNTLPDPKSRTRIPSHGQIVADRHTRPHPLSRLLVDDRNRSHLFWSWPT
jgi:hypothetical protein